MELRNGDVESLTEKQYSYWQDVRHLWSQMWSGVVSRPQLIGQLSIVFLLLALLPTVVFFNSSAGLQFELMWWGMVLALQLVSVVLTVATIRTVAESSGEQTLGQSLRWVVPRILFVILTSLVWAGLLLTGALLFIAPAIALLGYTLFTFVVSAREDVWGVRALVRSIELVRGAWWLVCTRVLLVLCGMTLLMMVPIVMLAIALAYAELTRNAALEATFLYSMLGLSAIVEAILAVAWARVLTLVYQERVASAKPFQDNSLTKVMNMVRTAAVLGWLPLVLAAVFAIGYVVQTPGALERVILFLETGI